MYGDDIIMTGSNRLKTDKLSQYLPSRLKIKSLGRLKDCAFRLHSQTKEYSSHGRSISYVEEVSLTSLMKPGRRRAN